MASYAMLMQNLDWPPWSLAWMMPFAMNPLCCQCGIRQDARVAMMALSAHHLAKQSRGFIRLEKILIALAACSMMAWIVISYGRLQNNCCCGIFYRRRSRAASSSSSCNLTNCFTSHFLMLCFCKCIYNGTGKNPVNFTEIIIIMPSCLRASNCLFFLEAAAPIGALVPRGSFD